MCPALLNDTKAILPAPSPADLVQPATFPSESVKLATMDLAYDAENDEGIASITREQPTALTTVSMRSAQMSLTRDNGLTAVGFARVQEYPDSGVDELGKKSTSVVHAVTLQEAWSNSDSASDEFGRA